MDRELQLFDNMTTVRFFPFSVTLLSAASSDPYIPLVIYLYMDCWQEELTKKDTLDPRLALGAARGDLALLLNPAVHILFQNCEGNSAGTQDNGMEFP
jgi:hypothetical protein